MQKRELGKSGLEVSAIGLGSRVIDLGAGPGYATIDLADIVGPRGQIVALERLRNFVESLRSQFVVTD